MCPSPPLECEVYSEFKWTSKHHWFGAGREFFQSDKAWGEITMRQSAWTWLSLSPQCRPRCLLFRAQQQKISPDGGHLHFDYWSVNNEECSRNTCHVDVAAARPTCLREAMGWGDCERLVGNRSSEANTQTGSSRSVQNRFSEAEP